MRAGKVGVGVGSGLAVEVNIYTDPLNTQRTLKTNLGLKSHIRDKKGRPFIGSVSPELFIGGGCSR